MLLAPQSLFYSDMLIALSHTRKGEQGDPLLVDPQNYFDPEDTVAEIIQGMVDSNP